MSKSGAKNNYPEGWTIVPHLANHYKYKGMPAKRIDRGRGMIELILRHPETEQRYSVIARGIYEAMRKMSDKLNG